MADDVVAALEDKSDQRIRRLFMDNAEPDFHVAMVGPDYQKARLEYAGFEGFVEAWSEWMSPFESYRIEIEDMIEAGNQVVSLVAMTGRTRTGGAEISAPGAAVWTVVDGRVRSVEFHLDRDLALRTAGLDPSEIP